MCLGRVQIHGCLLAEIPWFCLLPLETFFPKSVVLVLFNLIPLLAASPCRAVLEGGPGRLAPEFKATRELWALPASLQAPCTGPLRNQPGPRLQLLLSRQWSTLFSENLLALWGFSCSNVYQKPHCILGMSCHLVLSFSWALALLLGCSAFAWGSKRLKRCCCPCRLPRLCPRMLLFARTASLWCLI